MISIDLTKATGLKISQHTDTLDATLLQEPDPDWVFTDADGHEHRWQGSRLPTLVHVVDEYGVDEDGEPYAAVTHYECRLCHQHVRPGWRPGTLMKIAGIRQWEAEGYIDIENGTHLLKALTDGHKVTVLLPSIGALPAYLTHVTLGGMQGVYVKVIGTGAPSSA